MHSPRRHLNGPGLRTIRELSGLTLRDLADSIGKTPGYLSKIETGKQQPSPAVIARIAARLGVGIDAITYTVAEVAA